MSVDVPHWVYTAIDGEGRAIYVGMTRHPRTRTGGHRRSASWAALIDDFAIIGPFPHARAQELERELIRELDPPFNVKGRGEPRRRVTPPCVVFDSWADFDEYLDYLASQGIDRERAEGILLRGAA